MLVITVFKASPRRQGGSPSPCLRLALARLGVAYATERLPIASPCLTILKTLGGSCNNYFASDNDTLTF